VTIERDFAAWLERRDAAALARVFDATGGKLLLLAAHLAGGGAGGAGAQAQDLVQATFVDAMAHGAQWDRARPLWPWLAAILHNEARMAARRGRRRREVALDAADATADRVNDPARAAASDEALAAVLAAIDALPLPYRQVLRLRLVHGLRPIDIARSLEVPVGTVRAQLHRGLEQLRAALPAGVAGALALLVTGDDALLAQVRERVLEHATAQAPLATAAIAVASSGWWAMHGKAVALVVGGCVVLACLALATGVPGWFAEQPVVAAPPALVRAELPASLPPIAGSDGDAVRVNAGPVADRASWPLTVHVRTKSGEPIQAAQVSVWTTPQSHAFWNRESGTYLREDLAEGTTGADGAFRTSLDGLRAWGSLARRTTHLHVEARWPNDRPRRQLLQLPRTTEATSLSAVVELGRLPVVHGRVTDRAGEAIAGAQVGAADRESVSADVKTDVDGSFWLELPDEGWPARLAIAHPAHGTATSAVPARGAEASAFDLGTIVLDSDDAVHGRMLLGDGTPLDGIQINLQQFDPALGDDLTAIHRWLMNEGRREHHALAVRDARVVYLSSQTSTLADGSFRFAGLQPDGVYLLSMFTLGAPIDRVVRPGGERIDVRVDKQLLVLEAIDDQGLPAAGVQVFLDGYDPAATNTSWNPRPGFPERGQVAGNWIPLGDSRGRRVVLSPFGFVWRISVRDDAVQPVAVRHEALPGVYHATCRVVLREETRFGKLHVVAVDEHGAPVQFGAALKALDRDVQHNELRSVMPPEGRTWDLPVGTWEVKVVLGKEVLYMQDQGGHARGFQQHTVVVEQGRTTELKVVARPAGLVAFRFPAESRLANAWRSLQVEVDGRATEVLPHDPYDPIPTREGARPRLFVTKQALSRGTHTFLLQAEGCQPVMGSIDVVADQLTFVRVDLIAK
jgi:RNA polymerase sigma factor (sigma-70 family)